MYYKQLREHSRDSNCVSYCLISIVLVFWVWFIVRTFIQKPVDLTIVNVKYDNEFSKIELIGTYVGYWSTIECNVSLEKIKRNVNSQVIEKRIEQTQKKYPVGSIAKGYYHPYDPDDCYLY